MQHSSSSVSNVKRVFSFSFYERLDLLVHDKIGFFAVKRCKLLSGGSTDGGGGDRSAGSNAAPPTAAAAAAVMVAGRP